MNTTKRKFSILFLLLVLIPLKILVGQSVTLIDQKATRETKNLFQNLKSISKTQTLFGHQHATEFGHGWRGDENRSDVKSVTGSHPAVIGIDISGMTTGSKQAIEIEKQRLREYSRHL